MNSCILILGSEWEGSSVNEPSNVFITARWVLLALYLKVLIGFAVFFCIHGVLIGAKIILDISILSY